MGFTFDGLLKLKLDREPIWRTAALLVMWDMVPSVHCVYSKTKDPFGISLYAQEYVAVSRFLLNVVAGKEPQNPTRLKRDELNRV
jgi:hypothetical protein